MGADSTYSRDQGQLRNVDLASEMPQNLRCSIQTFPAQPSLIGRRNGLSVLEGEAPLGPSLSTHTQSLQDFAPSSNRQKIQHNSTWTSATQPALSVPAATEARPAAGAHGDTAVTRRRPSCSSCAGGQLCHDVLGHQQQGEWHIPQAAPQAGLSFLCPTRNPTTQKRPLTAAQ